MKYIFAGLKMSQKFEIYFSVYVSMIRVRVYINNLKTLHNITLIFNQS